MSLVKSAQILPMGFSGFLSLITCFFLNEDGIDMRFKKLVIFVWEAALWWFNPRVCREATQKLCESLARQLLSVFLGGPGNRLVTLKCSPVILSSPTSLGQV